MIKIKAINCSIQLIALLKGKNRGKSVYFQLHTIIVKQYLTEQNHNRFCSVFMCKKEVE